MISEYLMKGIDTLFSKTIVGPAAELPKAFNKETIRANLHSVVKDTPKISNNNSGQENEKEGGALTKSRLRTILEKNKDAQIKSVIRRDKSRSISPYQKISPLTENSPNKAEATYGDKIAYYREQRKTIEKSRVLEKSRTGGSNSRIFRVSSQVKIGENTNKQSATEYGRLNRTNTRVY